MNDNERAVMLPLSKGDGRHERVWVDDDSTATEDVPADDFHASLVSLGFIRAAIRRSMRFWVAMAVVGLLIGSGLYLKSPPTYQATTTLFLNVGPEGVPGTAIANDQAIAQSRAVAGLVVQKLKLKESISSFQGSYTVTPLTDRVLVITVSAPSAGDAVTRARNVANEFLLYRAAGLKSQQQQVFAGLAQQVNQASGQVNSINNQISRMSAQPPSPARHARLARLQMERTQAVAALGVLKSSVYNIRASTQETTASEVNGSQVVDKAALIPPHSRLKHLVLYGALGFLLGLVLGLAIVVIRALISDRLYRRDDIARALGAPVKLSVGTVRLSRWLPGRHGLQAAQRTSVRRIVAHLGEAVPTRSRGAAALAVVPVGDPQVAALSVMSLAVSFAQQGKRVVAADLTSDSPPAVLLGSSEPGVHPVNVHDAQLIVAVPEQDDVPPVGPLGRIPAQTPRSSFTEAVASACASSDVLLILAALDPSLGGEHLVTWAPSAVVMVTAGRSSWTKINAVGEMIRLAGIRLVSAVVVGADKTDESLGVIPMQEAGRDAGVVEESSIPDLEGSFITVDQGSVRGRSNDR